MTSKIRLAVNARRLVPDQIGGLENAFRGVFDVLLRRYRDEFEVTVLTSYRAADSLRSWKDLARVQVVPEVKTTERLEAALADHDVLYCPFFHLEPARPRLPSVMMIPDLQHEELPELFPPDVLAERLRTVRSGAARATRVLTLSEFSKRHIADCFHLPDEHVVVVHLDCRPEFREPVDPDQLTRLRRKFDLPVSYVLFPANNWPHKNHRGLFLGMAEHRRRFGTAPQVVLTGAEVEGADWRTEATAAGVADLVRHLGFVDRLELPALYDGAACLLFVSLFEGFGIPVVEAMRRGTPVIASNATSLPEITGKHALLVDPREPEAIAQALHSVMSQPDEARGRAERARQWVNRFSFEGAAEQTAELFRDVASVAVRPGARPSYRRDAKPRVFVVTPSFNQGAFLRDTIESVLAQDYEPLDYFVADGGSTDESLAILESYGDRVRWVSKPDAGQAAAIRSAWSESDAEIVAWLNSDDTYLPGAVSHAVDYLLEHPDVSMMYGNAWYTDRDGVRTEPYPTKPFDRELLRGECFICQPAAFVRREVFRVIDLPDPTLRYCPDYDLWIRLSERFSVGHLDEDLATSRMYAQNKTLGERDAVYQEVMAVAHKHFGHVARSWSVGCAHHTTAQILRRFFWYLPPFAQRLVHGLLIRRRLR